MRYVLRSLQFLNVISRRISRSPFAISLPLLALSSCAPYLLSVNASKLSTSSTSAKATPTFSGIARVVPLSSTSAHLSWSAATASDATASGITYEICRSTTANVCATNFSASYTVTGTNEYTVTGLTAGQDYYFSVRAKNTDGTGETNTLERPRLVSTNIRSLAIGGEKNDSYYLASCAASETDEKVRCWGDGYGSASSPTLISGLDSVAEVAAGSQSFCALKEDATVWCWGKNNYGQLGNGSNTDSLLTPVQVSGITTATAITAGRYFYCAIIGTGSMRCWGQNDYGSLGNNSTTSSNVPVNVSGITTATRISAGQNSICAVLSNSQLHCWGSNSSMGLVGVGTTTSWYTTPQYVSSLGANVSRVSVGPYHVCAVLNSGAGRCWGFNSYGQLGNGLTATSTSPVSVSGITTTGREVQVSGSSTCMVMSDGTVQCWGDNTEGELAAFGVTHSTTPAAVTGLSNVVSLVGSSDSLCARHTDDSYSCWGSNDLGPIADNTSRFSYLVKSSSFQNVSSFKSAGGSADPQVFSCAVKTDTNVYCMGSNRGANLGDGTTNDSPTLVQVAGITNAVQVSASADQSGERACAVLSDGKIYCWGNNTIGILGDGTTTHRTSPVQVSGITTATQLSMGLNSSILGNHACARLSGGGVSCWGLGTSGQLGNSASSSSSTPVSVTGISNAVEVAAGSLSSCARLSTGAVRCWGNNAYGQLGNASTVASNVPVNVSGITDAVSITIGLYHACAALSTGAVKCWGYNADGNLGDGTTTDASTPVTVPGVSGATQVGAGLSGTCARTSAGTVYCWGYNGYGELGGATGLSVPHLIDGVDDAASVYLSEQTTCILSTSGSIRCLGVNDYNHLGLSVPSYFNFPIPLSAFVP